MIKANLPRVLSTNDTFTVPVSVVNTDKAHSNVTITIEASTGFEFNSGKTFTVNIQSNKEASVSFELKAPKIPQAATITIKASSNTYSASSKTELAVRPPVPFTSITGFGTIKAPQKQVIKIPGKWLEGTAKTKLVITSLPTTQLAEGLRYLVRYPYGCLEQTTSATFPLLYLKDLAALIDPEKLNPAQINNYVEAGIKKILSMQTYSGGFSLWIDEQSIDNWNSIYATNFLIEAKKAGYAVPDPAQNAALAYAEKILSDREEHAPLELKAYSCYVLSKAGRPKPSWIRRLQEVKDSLPDHAKTHLAFSLIALGDKKAAQEILDAGIRDTEASRQSGDSLNSYTKTNAIALSMYMDIAPENSMVPVLVKRLQKIMKNGHWETTQDNARALLALGKYASYMQHQEVNYSGTVFVDGKEIASFDGAKDFVLDSSELAAKDVQISLEGKGTAYYYWSSEGISTSERVEEKSNGIKVQRRFFTRSGTELNTMKFKQGDIIIADITFDADAPYKNIVVEDLLPACFEIENPRISSSETVEWIKKDNIEPQHIDMRDDRLLLFTSLNTKNTVHYKYVLRAITKGKFILPAIHASCMYDPSVSSVSGQGYVEVE